MGTARRPRVLVVEDEAVIRWDLAAMLAMSGFEVRQASSAAAAIDILESDREISVVFTDIQMPGAMDGLELARCVRKRWPPTIIVITSGNVVDPTSMPVGSELLAKPYDSGALSAILNRIEAQLGG